MAERSIDRAVDPFFNLSRYRDYSDVVGSDRQRMLITNIDSKQKEIHEMLQINDISVFVARSGEEKTAYLIPDGTQTLEVLKIGVRRNILRYASVFQQVGKLSSILANAGYEISEKSGPIAQKTALVFDASRNINGVITLVPPYEIDQITHSPSQLVQAQSLSLAKSLATETDFELIRKEFEVGFYEVA